MKKLFNRIKYIFLSFPLLIIAAQSSLALCSRGQIPSAYDPDCTRGTPTIGDLINLFVPVIPVAIGMLLFGVLIWGAIQIFTSGPNEDQKKKGFQTIQNAITGVIILFLSVAIITIIESILGTKILFGVFINK